MRGGVRHPALRSRGEPASYLRVTLQKTNSRESATREGRAPVPGAAGCSHGRPPTVSPRFTSYVRWPGLSEARTSGKLLKLLRFLRGGPQADFPNLWHVAPDSAEPGPAGGSSGSPPSRFPGDRRPRTPRGKLPSQTPQPPRAAAALTFTKVLQPSFGTSSFPLGH